MGQFDSMGLKTVGEIGLSDPKKRSSTLTRNENKKKDKPKTAAAGGGANPPSKPPKGPTGPKNPNKGGGNEEPKHNRREPDKYLKKGTIKYDDRQNPRNAWKEKK